MIKRRKIPLLVPRAITPILPTIITTPKPPTRNPTKSNPTIRSKNKPTNYSTKSAKNPKSKSAASSSSNFSMKLPKSSKKIRSKEDVALLRSITS